MVVFDHAGDAGAYAVIGRMAADNVVLAQSGYGRTDAADGRVWPWVFGAHSNYWSQIAVKLNFMAQKEGGIDKMKGKTVVHLHIDTAYGREPLPAMRQIAQRWGFNADRNPDAPSRAGAAVAMAADPPREGRLGYVLGRRRGHERHRDDHRRPRRLPARQIILSPLAAPKKT